MGERLQGEEREYMRSVIRERLLALPDVPLCHCECAIWKHELDAEMRGSEVVILVQGHSPNDTLNCRCPGYEAAKEGFGEILHDVLRGRPDTFKRHL